MIRVRWCTGRHPCSMGVESYRTSEPPRPSAGTERDDHLHPGSRGVSEWTITGTEVGGDRIEVQGCDLWTFGDDGLIVKKDSFWKLRDPGPRAGKRSSRFPRDLLVEPASGRLACTRTPTSSVGGCVAVPASEASQAPSSSACLIGMRSRGSRGRRSSVDASAALSSTTCHVECHTSGEP